MAALAGMVIPAGLAAALRAADSYERMNPVGGSVGGGGGDFGGGDGGGDSGGDAITPTPASLAPGGLFGDNASSAFGNYIGGGPTVQQFGGDSGNGVGSPWGSALIGGSTGTTGGYIEDTSGLDSADGAANAALSAQSGTESTLAGMPGYVAAMGAARPNSAYAELNGTWGAYSGQSYPGYSAPVGQPTPIALSSDVFSQDNQPFTSYQKAITNSQQYTQQSQIDNSGITAGQIGAMLGSLPGRADGGPVEAGQTYQVAERGTGEFFTPSQNGSITPADPSMLTPKITINNQHPAVAPQNIQVTTQGNNVAITISKMIANNLANGGTIASTMANRFGVMPLAARRS